MCQFSVQLLFIVYYIVVGHGRSEGERVQISSFSIYVADVLKHIDETSVNNGGLPIFLFGHSMASVTVNTNFPTNFLWTFTCTKTNNKYLERNSVN